MYHSFCYDENGLKHCECHKPEEPTCTLRPFYISVLDETLLVSDDLIAAGDLYFANRGNRPGDILTCKHTIWSPKLKDAEFLKKLPGAQLGERFSGWIVSQELAYAYDFHECSKIIDEDKKKIERLWFRLEELKEAQQKKS
jgi:hypothetical protein